MSSKLEEITTKLHDLVDKRTDLGLNVNVERSNITQRRLEQTSLVDESKILGRDRDKVALLGKLLRNEECDENVSIVSIVGMGGIGKTTLAKVLYNEQKVKDHFEVMAWVCISEECDVINISKAIFQAVTGQNKDFANLDLLHVALREELSKKRFLLVLDDVWNEEDSKWEVIQSPLFVGAPGSRIIVTTRSTRVASVMDSQQTYPLGVLSNEDALSLFAQHALGEKNFDKHPTLKSHGEGMVHKCGRLPLALKTLGRVVKGNRDGDEWEELLKSEIWDIDDGNKILPALKLSYYRLPPHLKQLFAYCSLIPKDYVFEKNKLVLLWVAEGFLSQSKGNKSMENLGHEYFDKLATSVVGEFPFRLDNEMDASDMNETFDKFHHFSLVGLRSGSYRKLNELQRAKHLRTFLVMSVVLVVLGNCGFLDKSQAYTMSRDYWMYKASRFSELYIEGVRTFIRVAEANRVNKGNESISCPCKLCKNIKTFNCTGEIEYHLLQNGFVPNYTCLSRHGETLLDRGTSSSNLDINNSTYNNDSYFDDEHHSNDSNDNFNEMFDDMETNMGDAEQEKLQRLFEEVETPLYSGSKFMKLDVVLRLINLKSTNGWSDKSFTSLLEVLHDILPEDNELPISTYQAKKLMCPMGLKVERIHACPNNCMLYRKEFENKHNCVFCGASM
ncbi:unnamed protein product [Lactuca virosa]|uniref:NB-ARC domain-containing protein n=1 Tax=Lactuca virosa TaxID=75947 RepID=A0AAU9NRZ4_9ASTR|nr:unnamed protein product [Lactuca virosa]